MPPRPNDKHPIRIDNNTPEPPIIKKIPNACNMDYDAIAYYRNEIFIFKDEVSPLHNFFSHYKMLT